MTIDRKSVELYLPVSGIQVVYSHSRASLSFEFRYSLYSVEEDFGLVGLAVDINHKVGESGRAHHHLGENDGKGGINVGLIGISSLDKVYRIK